MSDHVDSLILAIVGSRSPIARDELQRIATWLVELEDSAHIDLALVRSVREGKLVPIWDDGDAEPKFLSRKT